MNTVERLDALEAELAGLRAKLHPQRMRDALEKTHDPRGTADWTRIISSAGALADPPRRTLSFPGAVTTDNPALGDKGATVVTFAPPTQQIYVFSDDGSLALNEQVRFVGQSAPSTVRASMSTTTIGGTVRNLRIAVSESDPLIEPCAVLTLRQDSTASPSSSQFTDFQLLASANGASGRTAQVSGTANPGGTNVQAGLACSNSAGSGITTVSGSGTVGTASLTANGQAVAANATAHVAVNGTSRYIFTGTSTSSFVQTCTDTTSNPGNAVSRIERGPFVAVPGALAAGATIAVAVNSALAGAVGAQAVRGTIQGAAGAEAVAVSWTPGPGANQITLSFTNLDLLAAHTATFQFYTLCDA